MRKQPSLRPSCTAGRWWVTVSCRRCRGWKSHVSDGAASGLSRLNMLPVAVASSSILHMEQQHHSRKGAHLQQVHTCCVRQTRVLGSDAQPLAGPSSSVRQSSNHQRVYRMTSPHGVSTSCAPVAAGAAAERQ